eukprot:TRINITY_DN39839_c1_g1_i1.p1 TRINITY_DN39839_c1_g1~~TRINITY_DN39839_c1_g1_i1.p1  ORF type:complete len:196 (-),score=26.61 TRINITY_DN39839_c1_g1_i1:242-793(-)
MEIGRAEYIVAGGFSQVDLDNEDYQVGPVQGQRNPSDKWLDDSDFRHQKLIIPYHGQDRLFIKVVEQDLVKGDNVGATVVNLNWDDHNLREERSYPIYSQGGVLSGGKKKAAGFISMKLERMNERDARKLHQGPEAVSFNNKHSSNTRELGYPSNSNQNRFYEPTATRQRPAKLRPALQRSCC